jgi:predicted aspartyl protease
MALSRVAKAAALLCGLLPSSAALADQCPPLAIVGQTDLVASGSEREYYVPMEIAGVRKLMLLDSGSAQTLITPQTATELGLKLRRSHVRLYSVTGSYSETMTTASIAIGALKGGNFNFQIAPANMFESDPAVAGILGADILSQFDISLDFPKRKLDIISQNHCDGLVVYWPERPVAIVAFERLRSGHIVLPVSLDGKTIKAILDTGASGSTLKRTVAENEFGLKPGSADAPAAGELNGEKGSTVWRHRFKTLSFEGVTVANPDFVIIPERTAGHFDDKELGSLVSRPNEQAEPDILLGMNVLRHLHVYIAYKEKKLYLTPAAAGEVH